MNNQVTSLETLKALSKTLNPHGENNISQALTAFDFDALVDELKESASADPSVQFFDTDPPSFKIGGVSFYRGGHNPESA